jgi:hypothetical protein
VSLGTIGENDGYSWEMTTQGWKITPKLRTLEKWETPRVLAKLDSDGLKATDAGRVAGEQVDHYGDRIGNKQ